jgi:hypothetical protein
MASTAWVSDFELPQQFQARHFGHDDIANHDIRIVAIHKLHRFVGVACLQGFKAPGIQQNIQRFANAGIIVNNQNFSFSCGQLSYTCFLP